MFQYTLKIPYRFNLETKDHPKVCMLIIIIMEKGPMLTNPPFNYDLCVSNSAFQFYIAYPPIMHYGMGPLCEYESSDRPSFQALIPIYFAIFGC